jgi:outer membrane protein assembly factor BamE (lipoprotein component of BamABCDE complex)
MRNFLKRLAIAALLGLAGCAGTDFVRPDLDTLKNGQTTYAQVVARMGAPRREGTVLKNEKTLKTTSYAYASTGGQPVRQGVTPARAMVFYFYNDTLAGHEFISSWAADSSDFDESKVKDIVKGKTTRAQLMQMLGKPAGYYVFPMIRDATGEAAVYAYAETTGSAFNLKFSRKILVVTFGTDGLATDVDFNSSSSQ